MGGRSPQVGAERPIMGAKSPRSRATHVASPVPEKESFFLLDTANRACYACGCEGGIHYWRKDLRPIQKKLGLGLDFEPSVV